jgi:hypothetical protein
MVEREEALHAEMAAAEYFFVQVGTEFLKLVEAIGHASSTGIRRPMERPRPLL